MSSAPPPPPVFGPPRAMVEQLGARTWRAYVLIGPIQYGGNDGFGWIRHSAAAAEQKAIVELARYQRKYPAAYTPREVAR